jgi:glucan 1,3-beta-glucosidase
MNDGKAAAPRGRPDTTAMPPWRWTVPALLAAALAVLLAWAAGRSAPVALADAAAAQLPCVSYAPFRRPEHSPFDPRLRVSAAQIEADLRLLATLTGCVRTYGLDHGIDAVPEIARRLGLRVVLGAWLGRDPLANEAQIGRALELARTHADVIDLLVIGNEVLLRRELAPEALAALLERVRREAGVPVGYADVWEFWLRHAPALRDHVDVVVAHILPYWEDEPVAVDQAVAHVHGIAAQLADAFAPTPVFVGETGWPAAGRQRGPAVPGSLEQTRFVRELLTAQVARPLWFNLIEGFDQPWKRALEGAMGGAWGLFDAQARRRVTLNGPVVADPRARQVLAAAALGGILGLAAALARRGKRREASSSWSALVLGLGGAGIAALAVVQWQALETWSRNGLEWSLGGLTALLAVACSAAALVRLAGDQAPPRVGAVEAARRAPPAGLRLFAWAQLGLLFAVAVGALGLVFDARYRPLDWWTPAGPAVLLAALALRRDGLCAGAREERVLAAIIAACAPLLVLNEGLANGEALRMAALLALLAAAVLLPHRGAPAGRASTSAASSTAGAASDVE